MAWATTTDVMTYTGVTVTGAQVEQAQGVIEVLADVTKAASDDGLISAKNLRLLRQAVAYQAAWMTQHPDTFTNLDASSLSQDQVSATMRHDNALILAPWAKRCIDRLSWRRNRALRIRPMGGGPSIPRRLNLTSAAADDDDPRWQPIGDAG